MWESKNCLKKRQNRERERRENLIKRGSWERGGERETEREKEKREYGKTWRVQGTVERREDYVNREGRRKKKKGILFFNHVTESSKVRLLFYFAKPLSYLLLMNEDLIKKNKIKYRYK